MYFLFVVKELNLRGGTNHKGNEIGETMFRLILAFLHFLAILTELIASLLVWTQIITNKQNFVNILINPDTPCLFGHIVEKSRTY